MNKLEDILLLIQSIEKPDSLPDDFNPADYSGGNFDDAYSLGEGHGYNDGRYGLAQEIKGIIEKE